MRITKSIIWTWLILFLPFFTFKLYSRYRANKQYEKVYSSPVSGYIGSKFSLQNFVDSSGTDAQIDFSKSEITVVDFWFKDCPPCIEDMQHYSQLIEGRDRKIIIFTVCINRFDLWKTLLHSSVKPFLMLSKQVPNWKHLVLKSSENQKLNNAVPAENLRLLQNTFQSTNFPMYLVLDNNGVIKATPFSLSKYIELDILRHNPFWYFLTKENIWTADYFFVPTAFVKYSGYFWIATILLLLISQFRNKKLANNPLSKDRLDELL